MARVSNRSKRQAQPQFSIGNLLGLFGMIAVMIGLFAYSFVSLTSGDWRWFDTSFEAMPQRITIIDRGQRTELDPNDPRFAPLAAAFNQTIEQGYRHASLGFSRATWADVDREGFLVETSYVQPVQLHINGGFHPTPRLLLLISGKNLHTTQVLFRRNTDDWDPIPLIVNTVEPLKGELERQGFEAAR
jgi:hypothetical protein